VSYGEIQWRRTNHDEAFSVSAKRKSFSWFSFELVHLPKAELEYCVKGNSGYLAIHDIVRSDGETRVNGEDYSCIRDLRDKLTFLPIGSTVEGWSRYKTKISSVFAVHFVAPTTDAATNISHLPPRLFFEDRNLKATLEKLRGILEGSAIDDTAYAETLGLLLLCELKHASSAKHPTTGQVRGGLTGLQLRRIQDFVDAKISNEISITDLSAVVGLSQFHFIRAFKESVGLSPYQYVLLQRIHRARGQLTNRDHSIADVARAVGFRDGSQLTRAFRKFLGITPTEFRRETA
jgi:AraC family transcriptional regulator